MENKNVFIKIVFLVVLIAVFGYIEIYVSLNGMFENLTEDVTGKAYSGIPSSFKYKFDKYLPSSQINNISQVNSVSSNDAALSGQAYYVSPNGNDANRGTSASAPFKTLGKAQSMMRVSAIKTTYLMGGIYDLSAPLNLIDADSGQSWLGYPGQTPILDGGNSVERGIYISGPGDLAARDITVRWLTIQNFTKFGIAMHAVRNVTIDSNTVRNINSDGWNRGAIYVRCGSVDTKITHNLVQNTGYIGIAVIMWEGCTKNNLLIDSNVVYDTMKSVDDAGAINLWDKAREAKNTTVSNN